MTWKTSVLISISLLLIHCSTSKVTSLEESDETKDTTSVIHPIPQDSVVLVPTPQPMPQPTPTPPTTPEEKLKELTPSIISDFGKNVETTLSNWDTTANNNYQQMEHETSLTTEEDGSLTVELPETSSGGNQLPNFVLDSKDTIDINEKTVYFETTLKNIGAQKFVDHGLDVGLMLESSPWFTFNYKNKEVYGIGFNWRPAYNGQEESIMVIIERDTIANHVIETKMSDLSDKTIKFQMVYNGTSGQYAYKVSEIGSDIPILAHSSTRIISNETTLSIEDRVFAHIMLYAKNGKMNISDFNTYISESDQDSLFFRQFD